MAVCSELATSYFCLAAIVGVDVLDFCVRDENRHFHVAIITRTISILQIPALKSTDFLNFQPPAILCCRKTVSPG